MRSFEYLIRRVVLASAVFGALTVTTACENTGVSGRDAEWARISSKPFHVVRAGHKRAILSVNGRQVAVVPASGFCLSEESIETSGRSAFVLIGDCAVDGPEATARSARGELKLPKSIPGIMTVSISGDKGFAASGSGAGTLDGLEEFIKSAFLDKCGVPACSCLLGPVVKSSTARCW
ncbi:MAG: hypothetical protein AAF408_16285, partial [Pseudomonadota bacterium]